MKALFLAGGMGTRLKPLTDDLPKPMVPIMVKPLLERNMLKLKDCGVDEIILSTCYKPQKIEEYFGDGTKLGLKIHYVCEDIPLDTGGAIKNTEEFFNETFIVINANIFSDIDITEMIKFHKEKGAAVTIAVTRVDNSSYDVIEYNINLYAESFIDKPTLSEIKSSYINAGIYIFEPNVLNEIPVKQVISIERETFPLLLKKGYPIAVYKSDAYWMDIGTVKNYIQVHQDILNGLCSLQEFKAENQDIFIGENTLIHPTVKIIGPVFIGQNTIIGAHSTIGPNTIIGNNCRVDINEIITDAILWDNINLQNYFTFSSIALDSEFIIFKNNMNAIETELLYEKSAL